MDDHEWDHLGEWWLAQIEDDPTYREEVIPLAADMLAPQTGQVMLELGCGEGQVMRAVASRGASVIGCDLNLELLRLAREGGPVVRARLPDLTWVRAGSLDACLAVLTLEHLPDPRQVFEAAARAVRPDGVLAAVMNHPVFTAPGSGPVVDLADGEVLWRWGRYLGEGSTREPAGEQSVTFHHQALGEFFTTAARAGWNLEVVVERAVGERAALDDPLLGRQREVPRLLGVRWRRR